LDDSLQELSAADLSERCREETARFRRNEPHDDRFCFEMISRAIVRRDDYCWTEMTQIYRDHVVHWCRRGGVQDADLEEMVTDTWEKFWRAYTAQKLAAAIGSAGALKYLQLCARSVVMDDRRRRGRTVPLPEPEQAQPPDPVRDSFPTVEPADIPAFWALVDAHLHTEAERLLVRLTYENGLRPAEIQRLHPDVFPTPQDVYKATRNILDRFRRSKEISRWLDHEPEEPEN
jgi:DNA-directed RNA polymerase specialized sigma24 family protein